MLEWRRRREMGKQRIPNTLIVVSTEPNADHDLSRVPMLNPLSHSSTPPGPILKVSADRGTQVAQWVKHMTLDLGLGHDLTVHEIEPGIGFCADSTGSLVGILYLPLYLSLPNLCFLLSLCLSFSLSLKINKDFFLNKK